MCNTTPSVRKEGIVDLRTVGWLKVDIIVQTKLNAWFKLSQPQDRLLQLVVGWRVNVNRVQREIVRKCDKGR